MRQIAELVRSHKVKSANQRILIGINLKTMRRVSSQTSSAPVAEFAATAYAVAIKGF